MLTATVCAEFEAEYAMRQAIIHPYTLGVISAHRMVMKDLSKTLGDPVIDVQRLFYAVMIQSGISRFGVPQSQHTKEVVSSALAERFHSINFDEITPALRYLHDVITNAANPELLSDFNRRKINDLSYFLQDLYIASSFRKPVVSAVKIPTSAELQGILRDDVYIVVSSLLNALEFLQVEAPLTRVEVPKRIVLSFHEVLQSNLFALYERNQSLLEDATAKETAIDLVGGHAHRLAEAFPEWLDIRQTSIGALQILPDVVGALAGRVFGELARPLISTVRSALSGERRLLIYTFEPVWRTIWDAKLAKVRDLVQRGELPGLPPRREDSEDSGRPRSETRTKKADR